MIRTPLVPASLEVRAQRCRKGGFFMPTPHTCSVCGKSPVLARGWCRAHYWRWHKWGDPEFYPTPPTLEERLWRRVDMNGPRPIHRPDLGPCWLWMGARTVKGYGVFNNTTAHRIAFILLHGPVPDTLEIDHLCRNKLCVRDDHLEAVTPAENSRRVPREARNLWQDRVTHCPQGHAYDAKNTRYGQNGARRCAECYRIRRLRLKLARS